jgi:hypothetical protein
VYSLRNELRELLPLLTRPMAAHTAEEVVVKVQGVQLLDLALVIGSAVATAVLKHTCRLILQLLLPSANLVRVNLVARVAGKIGKWADRSNRHTETLNFIVAFAADQSWSRV